MAKLISSWISELNIETLALVILPALVTWIIAQSYYRKGTGEMERVFAKLPDALVVKLAQQPERKMTLDELEEMIHEADAFPTEFGLFPNKCPKCSGDLKYHGCGSEYDPQILGECPDCGWQG